MSKLIGDGRLEIAVAFSDRAHPTQANTSLFEAACEVHALVCNSNESESQGWRTFT